ncbi:MAG TPA: NAD(P)-dependent oxidoreductase [Terriglobales bacterium]|nr:NAD(P)-dependent oxidoreductase [Terriglobales bacterium]
MSQETVLVTGGAGYVGSHLVRKLLERGYRVRVLEKFVYGDHGLAELEGDPRLEIRYGDIGSDRDMRSAAAGTRWVVALAAIVGDAACDVDPQETMITNFESTKTLIDACHAAGVQRTVFASSCSVYGAKGTETLDENAELNPVSLYARTRIMSEDVLEQRRGNLEVIILRLSTVCGWSPRMRFDLMVNAITARAAVEGTMRIVGANQWRPHIHVQDAAEAFLHAAVDAPAAAAQAGKYNTGGDHLNFTIGEVADKVMARYPKTKAEYVDHIEDRRSYRVSFGRIREAMGFVPRFSVDDAIEEVRTNLAAGLVTDYNDDIYNNLRSVQRAVRLRATA